MKLLVLFIIHIALFLLYRIAFSKQADTKKNTDASTEKPKSVLDVMGKSRFVLPDRSQPLQTPATLRETEKEDEKPDIFAPETEGNRSAVIPADRLDEVFDDEPNPVMSLPLEDENEDDSEPNFEAEEEEEMRRESGHEPMLADGMDYDDLRTVVKVVREQPETVSEATAGTLTALENTDMFEMLASGDEGIMNWIKSVIERHIRNTMPETEAETSDAIDYGDFVADFLG